MAGRDDAVGVAARTWAEALAAWAIPENILRRAPESPWGFPTGLFGRAARAALADPGETPSRHRARQALSPAGTVLDVGSGAGGASLPLVPPATGVTAVDESEPMLEAFSVLAGELGVASEVVAGRWPDAAKRVAPADVVVCHHVVYNVADLVPFLAELDVHARRRVVLELTATHPQSDLNDLWRALHGIERPAGPGADDLVALLRAMGVDVNVERFTRPSLWSGADSGERVAFARRRLCVGPERDDEIARLLVAPDRHLVTLWWDTGSVREDQ